jgi:REP element-mobilizing transposase RayT
MADKPLAYHISFTCYGAWLHGRDPGFVDKSHNQCHTPFLSPDPARERNARANMRDPPYLVDQVRRDIVLTTILEVTRHRHWQLWAAHVRSNHVHVVISADVRPEKVMIDLKAYASRRLKEQLQEPAERKRWTQHGSMRYLWQDQQVHTAIDYVLNGQGTPMAVYDGCKPNPIV